MPKNEEVRIINQKKIGPRHFLLTLFSENIAKTATPGQFVTLKVTEDHEPLLRRPLSIHTTDPSKHQFEILYDVVGHGTEILSKKLHGEKLQVLGPLGNGFRMEKETNLLVAGGMGIAPLKFLANDLKKQGKKVTTLIGGSSKDCVMCEMELRQVCSAVEISTDDGTCGKKGLVTELIPPLLSKLDVKNTVIYSCGPEPMLKEVARIARENKIECQVSMEAFMACGIGACLGCAIETKQGYKMVCKDGPVFNAEDLIW